MATTPNATSPNSENETPTSPTPEGETALPVSPARVSPDPLYYVSGEARVARNHRGITESSRTNPYPTPVTTGDTSTRTRRRAYARRWNWLPTTLDTWRSEEGIQIPTESMDISPYTQEPVHHTVPVLAARTHRHEERLDDLEREQRETRLGWMHLVQGRLHDIELEQNETRSNWIHMAQGTVSQIYQDQEDITETMGVVHNQVIGNRNEISVLQTRLEQYETRLQETEDHSRSLEQRLAMAEETLRMVGRLTETMERVVTLLPPPNPRQD